jgi:iron complex outermembrane receptor protein
MNSLSLLWGDWQMLMDNRYISDGQQDGPNPPLPNRWFIGNPLVQFVDFVDSVWYTDLSLTYSSDIWSVTLGVNNLFDEEPPLISRSKGPNRNNAVTSSGYDFVGRSIFATVQVGF